MAASARTLAVLDALAWTLVYGGLLLFVLGIATGEVNLIAGWSFGVVGGVAAVVGIVLILVRARLSGDRGAQSGDKPQRGST
jgi:membrane protein implicated in regulation of membrane protease activity